MKVTIMVDGINPFYDVLFTTDLKYFLDDVNKRIVDFTDEECARVQKFTKEMESIQNWLEKKFSSA